MQANLMYGLLFLVTVLASYGVLMAWWPKRTDRRLQALRNTDPSHARDTMGARLTSRWLHFSQWWWFTWRRLSAPHAQTGSATVTPRDPTLRLALLNAGLSSPQAEMAFQALTRLLAVVLPLVTGLMLWWWHPALQTASLAILWVLAGMIGYALPHAWLQRRIRHRQAQLFKGFPDALDLMRMCIQAGLGLDATLDRVGREIRMSCPPLSQELALTGYELRAGASRAQALRHLSERIALQDVEAWVNTLIQSDRFGTSLSESLQVYSDALRNKRKLMAQEAAAKLPIKLLIPLVFCLFPGLLTVLLGPAVINITTHLMPVLSNVR